MIYFAFINMSHVTWLWMIPRKLGFDAFTQLVWVIVDRKLINSNIIEQLNKREFIKTYNNLARSDK